MNFLVKVIIYILLSTHIICIFGIETRYLLYDVNPGEGFNLRRDVYIRVANLVRFINKKEKENWTLVLPPWGRIYHWFSSPQDAIYPWAEYFDLESLRKLVPVMEFHEFIKQRSKPEIDEVYYLQSFPMGGESGAPIEWRDRWKRENCREDYHGYYKHNDLWYGWFFGYQNDIAAKSFECLSVQLESVKMRNFLSKHTKAKTVMLDRAENLIHGSYSEWSQEYWTGRRSMVFSERLHRLALSFLRNRWPAVLPSGVMKSLITWQRDWRLQRSEIKSLDDTPAFVAVHMRRMDFIRAHVDSVPSLKVSAEQALVVLKKLKLNHLFVATDAPEEEVNAFRQYFPTDIHIMRFEAPSGEKLADGALAVIDQIICSLARHFIGTCESTFSFRINEERAILKFPPESTYNCFCADSSALGTEKCPSPTVWPIQYEPSFTLPAMSTEGHSEL